MTILPLSLLSYVITMTILLLPLSNLFLTSLISVLSGYHLLLSYVITMTILPSGYHLPLSYVITMTILPLLSNPFLISLITVLSGMTFVVVEITRSIILPRLRLRNYLFAVLKQTRSLRGENLSPTTRSEERRADNPRLSHKEVVLSEVETSPRQHRYAITRRITRYCPTRKSFSQRWKPLLTRKSSYIKSNI
jgi:hypothetical protein